MKLNLYFENKKIVALQDAFHLLQYCLGSNGSTISIKPPESLKAITGLPFRYASTPTNPNGSFSEGKTAYIKTFIIF